MTLYIGADHRGFELKELIKAWLGDQGIEFQDLGSQELDPEDDYPDIAKAVAQAVSLNPNEHKGIVICNNGVGVDIVANKMPSVRCCLGFDTEQILLARHDDDINVLALPSGFINLDQAADRISVFLNTDFSSEEKYQRRIDKIKLLENA